MGTTDDTYVLWCPHCELVYSPDPRIYVKDPEIYCPRCGKKLVDDDIEDEETE